MSSLDPLSSTSQALADLRAVFELLANLGRTIREQNKAVGLTLDSGDTLKPEMDDKQIEANKAAETVP